MVSSTGEGSEDRIDVLRRKIAALESLASNPGTTVAESESAQSAANKMRLELAKLVREAKAQGVATSTEGSADYRHESAPENETEAESTPREAAARTRAPGAAAPAERTISIRAAPAWTWQIPVAGLVVLGGVAFWLQRADEPARAENADSTATAPINTPAGLGAASAREGERNAILARIAKKGGNAAVAEALRACHMRDLLKEFQSTSGAVLRAGETPVDVRRRCGAYLTVRGLDDAICFPATDANPHPPCPIPE